MRIQGAWLVGGMILGASILFGLESKFGGQLDERTRQRVEAAEHTRDSALALARRQDEAIRVIRADRAADSIEKRQLLASIERITAAHNRLSTDVQGIVRLLPGPDSRDTVEIVGPRTARLINDQQATIVNLRGSRMRDSLDIERLFVRADSLSQANRGLESAYQKLDSAFKTVSGQRYGWKDRVTASVCYEPIRVEGPIGGGACITVARPLRLLDRLPTWLGGVR